MYLQTNYSERFPASPILMQELRGQHCSASRAGTLAKVGVQIELTRLGQPLLPKKKKKNDMFFSWSNLLSLFLERVCTGNFIDIIMPHFPLRQSVPILTNRNIHHLFNVAMR